MKSGNIIVNITANQDGYIGIWLDEPVKTKSQYIGKFMLCNSIIYNKMKKFTKEANVTFDSDIVIMSI